MKYFWILLCTLPLLSSDSLNSEWEIHYLTTTYANCDDPALEEMLSVKDSAVVSILATDRIKRYHYSPGETVIKRAYYLAEGKETTLDPQTFEPISAPVNMDNNFTVDWEAVVEKTGNTKMIAGFKCEEYAGGVVVGTLGQEIDSHSRFWIMELSKEAPRNLHPQYYLKGGIVLEKETITTSVERNNTLMTIMEAKVVLQRN